MRFLRLASLLCGLALAGEEFDSPRLRALAGVRLASRSFRYTDSLASLVPSGGYAEPLPQSLPVFPALHLELDSFPWRNSGWLDHIGVFSSLDVSPFLRARHADESFEQSYFAFHAGLQGRIALGPVFLIPRLGAGFDTYRVDRQSVLPSVRYAFMSTGLGARFERDGVSLEARGDARFGLDAGAIRNPSWFPETHFLGMNLAALVGFDGRFVGLSSSWSLHCGVELTQYGLDFNPIPIGTAPERVAGGAEDRTLSVFWALGFAWPESTRGARTHDDF